MDSAAELSTLSGLPPECFADAVFNRYAQRLLMIASDRLGSRLKAKVSPEDVVQSAFKSFFRRRGKFQFQDDAADGLWGLLVVITIRKCTKWADVFGAAKRAAGREVPLDGSFTESCPDWELAGREPGPVEAAQLAELVEAMMSQLDARQQQILALRMQGYELDEIAAEVHSSRRTVSRVISEAKDWLRERLASDAVK